MLTWKLSIIEKNITQEEEFNMKKVLIISIFVVSLLSAKHVLVDTNDALSVKVSSR